LVPESNDKKEDKNWKRLSNEDLKSEEEKKKSKNIDIG